MALIALTVLPALMVVAAPAQEAHAFCNRYSTPLGTYCPHEGHDSITYDAAVAAVAEAPVATVADRTRTTDIDPAAQVISNIGNDSRVPYQTRRRPS